MFELLEAPKHLPLLDFCLLGSTVYCAGVSGIIINRRSFLNTLISLELALLGIFLTFVLYSQCSLIPLGQVIGLLILVAAASESAVGLALVVL
jgi:NADH-quinone oxidoreductase subunit K